MDSMALPDMALMFKALGDPTRLHIFDFLRAQCCPVAVGAGGEVRSGCGPTAGEVCCHLTGQPEINSTISHHLKELRLAGLITMERRGKTMICGINQEAALQLAAYLSRPSTETEYTDCLAKDICLPALTTAAGVDAGGGYGPSGCC